MKVGGGGSERFMITVPLIVGLVITIYALGGPDRALALTEQFFQTAWTTVRNAVR